MSENAIGICIGDVWGIGPEITLKALLHLHDKNSQQKYHLYCSAQLLKNICEQQQLKKSYETLMQVVDITWFAFGIDECAQEDALKRAKIAKASLNIGIDAAQKQEIKLLVTAPLDKKIMQHVIPGFAGHTEYLQEQTSVKKTWMMLDNTQLKIVLLTNHLLLKDVPAAITSDLIKQAIADIDTYYKKLHNRRAKIVVCALNPHCGELSETSEEKTIITPCLEKLKHQEFNVEGPFSADALMHKAKDSNWDIVLAMYHDQGLVAAKYPGVEQAVNVTLGLPFVRVSPAHGVAYDLVGKNKANYQSMLKALKY